MMFGRPPAPQKRWGEMFLYEKVHHVVDHSLDFMVSKCRWWLPSVAVSVALSMYLLGGPEGPMQATSLAGTALQPLVSPVLFAPPPDVPPMEEEEEEL